MFQGIRRRVVVPLALAGVAAGVAASGFGAADAATVRHTLRLTAVQISDVMVRGVDVATDRDMQHGKVTGYDVTSCRIHLSTRTATCQVAVARAGGMIVGRARINLATGAGHGVITGGTGTFSGARGTISTRATGPATTRVTLVYHS